MSDVDPVGPHSSASARELREEQEYDEARKRSASPLRRPHDGPKDATFKSGAVATMNEEYNAWTSAEAPTLFEGGIV